MPPINILVKPASSLCNMRCKYCFYADVAENRSVPSYGIMREETLENLIQKVFQEAEMYASFSFQGGEPTLTGLDFYRKVLKLQEKYNVHKLPVHNAIQTNGYCINEEWADFFARNHFLVGLSMDGTEEIHNQLRVDVDGQGTYERIQRTSEIFDQYKVEYNILCVVNDLVARYPKRVYNSLKKYKYLQFIPCLDPFDGEKIENKFSIYGLAQYPKRVCDMHKEEKNEYSLTPERYFRFLTVTFNAYYEDFMRGNYVSVRNFDNYIHLLLGRPPENCAMCGVCTCNFVAEGDGSVYPCDFYVLDEWKLGNLNEHSLNEMRSSEQARRFVQISAVKDPACEKCEYYFLCRGGCRREREPIVNDVPGLNRMCLAYKQFFENNYNKMCDIAMRLQN